ncbi:hypothetical protein CI105_07125 [Candidatus Izimaplasma bacterium ZiA1]|uniref:FAD-binding oxidoreductase n=1 Tax=Candidatus Izimoplasma sp. ZiA1 TaxID=2024899 RepID=UPI000BAA5C10|nr:hypothetical protein CI105_07125 [Candidatus Izimaplasma bacterium ZiA1]
MINNDLINDYLNDESLLKGNAKNIFFCLNTEDVQKVIKDTYTKNIPLTIQGALTGICGGAVPFTGDILNLSKMDKILGISKDANNNYSLRVQPGLLLKDLNHALNTKKMDTYNWSIQDKSLYNNFKAESFKMFPCDPTETLASIGGMIACEASGAASYMYGSIRKYINAITIVTPLKTINITRGTYKYKDLSKILGLNIDELPSWKKQQQEIKDVAGLYYKEDMDLIDLFIGSEGIFGVITEIDILLINKPKNQIGLMLFLDSSNKLVDFIDWLRAKKNKKYNIAAIEYFDKKSFDLLNNFRDSVSAINKLPIISSCYEGGVYLEFHVDNDELIEPFIEELNSLFKRFEINQDEQWFAFESNDYEKLKLFRHAVPECVNILIANKRINDQRIHKVGTDMSTSSDLLFDTLKMYNKDINTLKIDSVIFGHIGDNHLHVNLIPNTYFEYEAAKKIVKNWAEKITSKEGSISAEHGIGKIKKEMLRLMFDIKDIDKMKKLRKLMDPKLLINKGTFLD